MSFRGAAGGEIVARGEIRVDAARALVQLRQHLLSDPYLYLGEMVRSLVAGGATFIDVACTGGRIDVTSDAAPLDPARLARLFQFLLGEDTAPEASRLRLLARGVNAALATGPSFIDVYSFREGTGHRVRVTLQGGDGSAPLLEAGVEPVSVFERGPATGTCVRIEHGLGWQRVRRALLGELPREVALLRDATRDLEVVLRIDGAAWGSERKALARVPFQVSGARRAFVEILPPGAPARAEFLELGVLLVRSAWSPLPELARALALPFPVRLVVDAEALPTNASRSSLREDAVLPRAACEAAEPAFERAVAELAELVMAAGQTPSAELADALGLILASTFLAQREAAAAGVELRASVRAWLELPVLLDAVGVPRALSALLGREAVHVYRGAEPLSRELEPFLPPSVWLRGTSVERALTPLAQLPLDELIESAHEAREQRRLFLAHAATGPRLTDREEYLARTTFEVSSGALAGLCGEVAVCAMEPGVGHTGSSLEAYVEGRLLESIAIVEARCPMLIDAALEWPGHIVPRTSWDAVELNSALEVALTHALKVALTLSEGLARALPQAPRQRAKLVRPALRAALESLALLSREEEAAALAQLTSLCAVPLFRTSDGRRVSFDELRAYAARTGALCHVRPSGRLRGGAPDGRPVLVGGSTRVGRIAGSVGARTAVSYEIALERAVSLEGSADGPRSALRAALLSAGAVAAPILELQEGGVTIAVGVAPEGRLVRCHAGRVLATEARPSTLGSVIIAVDHPETVPTAGWDGVHFSPELPLAAHELAFCEAVVTACEGDVVARRRLGMATQSLGAELVSYLIASAARLRRRPERPEERGLLARLEAVPLLSWLDEDGRAVPASLSAVRARHPAAIPVLASPPGFATLYWWPLLLVPELREAISAAGVELTPGEPELAQRAVLAVHEQHRRELHTRLRERLDDFGALAARAAPVAEVHGPGGAAAAFTFSANPRAPRHNVILCEGYRVCTVELAQLPPGILGRFDLPAAAFDGYRALSLDGWERLGPLITDGVRALGASILAAASGPERGKLLFDDERALALILTLSEQEGFEALARPLLDGSIRWRTIQGGEVAFPALEHGTRALRFGRERYAPWLTVARSSSELDRPILHADSRGLALLERLGCTLTDVTEAAAALQRRRSARQSDAPRLPGAPVHPELRYTLEALQVGGATGEVELCDGSACDVTLIDVTGERHTPAVEGEVVFRMVARVDCMPGSPEISRVLRSVTRGMTHLLERLAPRLDELPPWVRDQLARVLLDRAARLKEPPKRHADLALFGDTRGAYHSLNELLASSPGTLQYTQLPPPYPELPLARTVLRLTVPQAAALGRWVRLASATPLLRKALRAQERANAPPVEELALKDSVRRDCVVVVAAREEAWEGEMGLLRPGAEERRSIRLHVGRRPLCTLLGPPELPIVAAVDHPGIRPDRWFTRVESRADEHRMVEAIVAVVRRALENELRAPEGALATRWIEGMRLGECFFVLGRVWLPARWPAEPRASIRASWTGTVRAPLVTTSAGLGIDVALPLEGALLIYPLGAPVEEEQELGLEGLFSALGAALLTTCSELVNEAALAGASEDDLAGFRWNLGLFTGESAPGKGERSGFWHPVMDEPGSPFAAILRAQAPSLIDLTPAVDSPRQPAPAPSDERAAGADRPGSRASWFASLRQWLAGAPDEHERALEDPVCLALYESLRRHAHIAEVVHEVVRRSASRPVEYEAAERRLVIARDLPLVRRLDAGVSSGDLALLTAAALSEINRELESVTDATEQRALLDLLRAL